MSDEATRCPKCGSTRHTVSFADTSKRRCKDCSHLWQPRAASPSETDHREGSDDG